MRRFLIVIVIIISHLFLIHPAQAHVLKTDGSIGAVIHIDPEDDPIAGQPATFFFEFKDKQNKFDGSKCDCTVHIIKEGNELFARQLFQNTSEADLNTPIFSFTFPVKAVYTVQVTGSPRDGADFQSFSLSYDIRVDREVASAAAQPTTPTNHTSHYIIFGLGFVVLLMLYFRDRKLANKAKKVDSAKLGIVLIAAVTVTSLLFHDVHMAHAASCVSGEQVAHQCCLPQLAKTDNVIIVSAQVIRYGRVEQTIIDPSVVVSQSINNKSPPV